ncbi:unnamed protein product [Adineta ricciae]|uniref:VWFA domain-containing protein n=1 Tax=Adineta ricciae TaxID=249248 RepID=A0A815MVM3_ADIRI|nr:unnamed protein product [Adineta ricciae]CAF1652277.1 unnamed protein product [Adineta ricciae]
MAANNSNLDLVFAMDCTGSMGSYIKSATDNIRMIIDEIIAKEKVTIRLALVEYRDHPPQFYKYSDRNERMAGALREAFSLPWRSDATKICILISDAPPHGLVAAGDGFPSGCPADHDSLNIARNMVERSITLYTVGVEPPIVPYREFFMAIAHITGGQYVPMADANKLAQMIIGGVREEISLDRVMNSSKRDIAREVHKAARDGVDDNEAAKRLQKIFSEKNVVVNRMRNEARTPSKAAEECYAKCTDMSDIQQQYQQSIPTVSHTKAAEMDYKLEENKPVSFEQAKRIVQKAKNWDYSSIDLSDDKTSTGNSTAGTPCKHGARCRDRSDYH